MNWWMNLISNKLIYEFDTWYWTTLIPKSTDCYVCFLSEVTHFLKLADKFHPIVKTILWLRQKSARSRNLQKRNSLIWVFLMKCTSTLLQLLFRSYSVSGLFFAKKEFRFNIKTLQNLFKCSHVKYLKTDLGLFLSDRQKCFYYDSENKVNGN